MIAPQTSYAISLMLTHFRYTLALSYIEHIMFAFYATLFTNNAHIASDMSISDIANDSSILSTEEGM